MSRNDLPSDNAPNFGPRVRETLMAYLGAFGDPLDRGITLRDLVDSGFADIGDIRLAKTKGSLPLTPGSAVSTTYVPDLLPPPEPTGFHASAAITNVFVEHDEPKYQQGHGHLRTHVYGAKVTTATLPTFSDAVPLDQFTGTVRAVASDPSTTWRLWIKWESVDGVLSASPAGGTNGLEVKTGQDVAKLLEALSEKITTSQLHTSLGERINLIDDPTTGLVKKVGDLQTTYGDTVSSAQNSAAAAQSASNAAAAKAAALLAQTGAETAKSSAESAKTSAQTAAATASTKATEAAQSATGAAGSAATATTQAQTAAQSAQTATDKATAAATSATSAATFATAAETSSTAANSAKVAAETAKTNAANSASAAATSAQTATTKATEASTSATAAASSATTATTKAGEASTSATQAATSATNAAGSASSAATSATTAANSATSAGNSATAAATSATSAGTSATNAGNSATAAAGSATIASTKAGEAATSATAAATSASTATTKATEAAQSATSAASSATSASTNASTALTYKNDAATSASTATTKASEASTSAGAAATSATNASNSATAAATSASTASTKATEASQSATSATTSATNASTSASNAGVYASNAASSATNAAGSANSAATALTQIRATVQGVSLTLPLDQWALGSQSIVSISDGKVGTAALRLSGNGSYPNQGTFVAINPGKKYRAKFWARPSSNCAGLLYFSLRQFTADNASSHGPVNGGRSPYKPSGVSRETHVATYGDTWGEYNFVWSDSDWQGGVKFFQPEFLDNYPSAAGYWDIQGLTLTDVTDVELTTVAVQTEATARVNADNTLFAQYTVKVDANGYVSGYGLASEANNASPKSTFAVRSDTFYIASPSGPGVAPAMPFIVRTTPVTINGVNVPIGVYMNDAFIQNGTITNAKIADLAVDNGKIANLSADKINAGYLHADRIEGGSIDAKIARLNAAVIGDGTLDAARIGDGTITNAKIGNVISSNDFNGTIGTDGEITANGTTGWAISKLGRMVLNKAYVRGDVQANSLNAATGTFTGTLNSVNGTFTGTLVGAKGSFEGELTAGTVDLSKLVGQTTSYNTPGTFNVTVPANFTSMRVLLIGGGGGGATSYGNWHESAYGGGGGGGGLSIATYSNLTPGQTITVTVGAGGDGGPDRAGSDGLSAYFDGKPGGSSSVHFNSGAYGDLVAGGGSPGVHTWQYGPPRPGSGGAGTTANGYDGGTGGGKETDSHGGDAALRYGIGGSPNYGSNTVTTRGSPGGAPGAGGAGGVNYYPFYGGGGGRGGDGKAVVEFYNPNGVIVRSEWNALMSALQRQGILTS